MRDSADSTVSPMPLCLAVGKINDASSGSDWLAAMLPTAAKETIGSFAVMCVHIRTTAVCSVRGTIGRKNDRHENAMYHKR